MKRTKLLCFDVESNGLHGEAFAVAGIVLNLEAKRIEDKLYICCPIDYPNDWVKENVMPHLRRPTHNSAKAMRDDFWAWLMANKADALVMADVAYPVEARFLAQCQDDDLVNREFEAPYPLYDVSSLLLASGIDPDVDREQLVRDDFEWNGLEFALFQKHNPLDDAFASALCAKIALTRLGVFPKVESAGITMMKLEYRAVKHLGSWAVLDRSGRVLYDEESGELSQQEADDLAWAFNHGATEDFEACEMIIRRYRCVPDYLQGQFWDNHGAV